MTAEEKGLGKAGLRFDAELGDALQFEVWEEPIRLELCRLVDDIEAAREVIRTEGLFTLNRYGQRVPNPALTIERKAAAQFAALLAQLDLRTPSEKPKRGRPGEFEARTRLLRESLAHNGGERWQ